MICKPILTDAERAVLQARLDDARSQYHSLITGTAARVVVDQNGERVEFTTANRGSLAAYISSLESQLAKVPAAMLVTPPAQFFF
jgi:membrane protease subunit (stomatin/prohibitin family)